MVQALVELSDDTNRLINIVKARFGLKDKGEAITMIVSQYAKTEMEPDLNPEFISKINKIEGQKSIKVSDFRGRYGVSARSKRGSR
jgi:hypothetical protein